MVTVVVGVIQAPCRFIADAQARGLIASHGRAGSDACASWRVQLLASWMCVPRQGRLLISCTEALLSCRASALSARRQRPELLAVLIGLLKPRQQPCLPATAACSATVVRRTRPYGIACTHSERQCSRPLLDFRSAPLRL